MREILKRRPGGIVISPGPGRPENAGICVELIRTVGSNIPLLGVCLGHQAIGYAFGGTITRAPQPMHGKTSLIYHNSEGIFQNVTNPFEATRYHSLIINKDNLPKVLKITATTEEGVIMGIKHKELPIEGIQFHPESVLTTAGTTILMNWLKFYVQKQNDAPVAHKSQN